MRNAYNILVGNSQEKRPFGGPRRRCEDNIIMDLKEVGWEVVDWIHLASGKNQSRALVNMIFYLRVP
jgi:hypothetical protein